MTARHQHAALAGRVLTGSDIRVPRFATVDLSGQTVREVASVGKHLFHRFDDLSLHTHLKMEGSWRTVAPGGRWPRPAFQARVVLTTAEAARRLAADPAQTVFGALLDQRNLAGIGNVYANELCFVRGLVPTRPIGEVGDIRALVDLARRMLWANRGRADRSTTGDLRPGRRTWVYGRTGEPCRRCGTALLGGELGRRDDEERVVTWCPVCQR